MKVGHLLWGFVLYLEKLPPWLLLTIGLAFSLGMALLGEFAESSVSLAQFYVIPVVSVAWLTRSIAYGVVIAAVTAAIGPIESILLGWHAHGEHTVLTALLQFAFYLVVVWLLSLVWRDRDLHEERSITDPKTGVANARAFQSAAATEVERSRRHGHHLSLLYVDIDDFKAVNDRWGHQEGDRILKAIVSTAEGAVRSIDLVARIGGDEFVILMPETSVRAAKPIARRFMTALETVATPDGVAVTCSLGLVTYCRPPDSVKELLSAGDGAMYDAKTAGKNSLRQVVISDATSPSEAAHATV